MNNGIPDEHFQKIVNVLKKFPQITEAILFGSRAKGNFREGSDIDLALKGSHMTPRLFTEISLEYDALYLPWKLGLVDYSSVENSDLKDHINRVGIPIYP